MVEESSDEEEAGLGVRELPDDDSDDEDTPLKEIAERRHKLAVQGEGGTTPGQITRATGEKEKRDDEEEDEDDKDVSESEILALQAKHKAAEQ